MTKKNKIGRNYCHQNWWHFRHSKTHQFLQITKMFTKIGENSIENSNHQNFHQNLWKFWRKFTGKWMWSHTFETTFIFYKIVPNFGGSFIFFPFLWLLKIKLWIPKIFTKLGEKKKRKELFSQNWWYFCHLKTHQFHSITIDIDKISIFRAK